MENGYPLATYGKLGLWRATDVPPMDVRLIEKGALEQNAYGAKGVGEITTIPTAPSAALACMRVDGKFRDKLPLEDTAYRNTSNERSRPGQRGKITDTTVTGG